MSVDRWKARIRGLTIGAGTPYRAPEGREFVSGLDLPPVRTSDLETQRHGAVPGPDRYKARVLGFPMRIRAVDDTEAMQQLRALKQAWQATDVDVELDITVPGLGPVGDTLTFFGRPRPLDADLSRLRLGVIDLLATFTAGDPFGYGPEQTVSLANNTPTTIPNDGDATTRRVVVTFPVGAEDPYFDIGDDAWFGFDNASYVVTGTPTTCDTLTQTVSDESAWNAWTTGGTFLRIPPGGQEIQYLPDTGGGLDPMSVTWRSAWL